MKRIRSKSNKIFKWLSTLLLVVLYGILLSEGKGRSGGGKTIAKTALSGLAKISMVGSDTSFSMNEDRTSDRIHSTTSKSALYTLNRHLMLGYDRSVRPVIEDSDIVEVEVDVMYRQVLDMDEKNQVLTSLVWYRQHWKDVFLQWEPEQYMNITEAWLSSDAVWMPDIILQEETGTKDYSPRLPFVKVSYDGHVEYNEPVTLTTSCSMNTMHFPFDIQHCALTFSSWSLPGSKLLITPERTTDKMQNDLNFFINTGEWLLEEINVREMRADYSQMMVESVKDYSSWPQVLFVVTLRRNSSFYVQSMIFPRISHRAPILTSLLVEIQRNFSVLLTSIALLGFFLPPDSGERVGLQITILLTFMVFLLTVCEMFPASTGPYLGMYYVVCTFLLAINLLMTVIVLRLYYHPCRPVYPTLKKMTYFAGKFCCVDVTELQRVTKTAYNERKEKQSSIFNDLRRAKSVKLTRCLKGVCTLYCCRKKESHSKNSPGVQCVPDVISSKKPQRLYASPPTPHFVRSKQLAANQRSKGGNTGCACKGCEENRNNREKHLPGHNGQNRTSDPFEPYVGDEEQYRDAEPDANMEEISSKLSEIVGFFKYMATDVKMKNKDVENENEWKSIALVMDRLFLRLYFAILLVIHIAILAMAMITMYTMQDPFHKLAASTIMDRRN